MRIRPLLRRAAAAALAAALMPAAASAQSAPYVDWAALLPPLPGTPHHASTEPDCADGSPACIERTIEVMEERRAALGCDHRAVFALAYLRVTEAVRDQIASGLFADPVWLAHEDAVFARMYFTAYDRWAAGDAGVPAAWRIAFGAAERREVPALGNFLLSMNAHINRDMPFMLAAIGITAPDGTSRKPDHDVWNRPLAALYEPVLEEIAERYDPTADDFEAGPVDDEAAYAVLQSWREGVWRNAERLTRASGEAERAFVAESIERGAEAVGRSIAAAMAYRSDSEREARDAWCQAHTL